MSDSSQKHTPKTQPSSAGGPPRPPKKTAKGLADDDDSPEPLNVIAKAMELLRGRDEGLKRKQK
jgi:hypothetical protein